MTRGLRNNNPLNIRRNNTKWQGLSATQTDKSFFQFTSMAYGYRAAFKTLQTYILNKYDTDKDGTANELEDVIMRWAPPCENNTDVYIATVEKRSGISRHTILNRNNREQLVAVVAAMSYVENGVPANMDDVMKGWELIQEKQTHKHIEDMANLNFTLKEEDWYESQPIQLSTGKFAISINFGDAANNRVVVYKSSNGKDYVPYKTALGVGEFCDMNVDGLIAGQYVMVGCNELPISSSFLESSDGSSSASKSDILAESGRAQLAESQLEQSINAVKTALDELVGTVDATTAIDTFNEIETFLAGVTNEKTLTGMLAVTDGKAVTAQTTADAAKSTAQTALSKATANETKLNTIPEMPENDGKIYGFCNGAWVVIAEVGKNVYTD